MKFAVCNFWSRRSRCVFFGVKFAGCIFWVEFAVFIFLSRDRVVDSLEWSSRFVFFGVESALWILWSGVRGLYFLE